MSAGGWVLRVAIFTSFSFGIALLVTTSPTALQKAADTIFFFDKNAQQRVYELAALLVAFALGLWAFSERSIGNAAVGKYRSSLFYRATTPIRSLRLSHRIGAS